MNAAESALVNMNHRLTRIQTISRVIRLAILGILAFTIGYYLYCCLVLWGPPSWERVKFTIPAEVVLCLWYWKLADLFHFYERGSIFAKESIRCIKTLGYLCIINWLTIYAIHALVQFVPSSGEPLPLPKHLQQNITVYYTTTQAVEPMFRMSFFSFSILGINFGYLLAGIVIVIFAWILDEGRKIQEEQELTV